MEEIKCDKEQLNAVRFHKGCCNVVASAGSGKTRVIVARVEHLIRDYGVAPEKILVVTFSRKARDELQGRILMRIPGCAEDITVTTFHALGNQIVKSGYGKKYRVLNGDQDRIKLINNVLSDRGKKNNPTKDAAYYLQYISAVKNRMETPASDTVDGAVYYAYEHRKNAAGCLDFDDMVIQAVKILRNDTDACKTWQSKYEFVFVDEMQDISAVQYELLRAICQSHKNLFVVGDPLQNIYQWRGSDNRFMLNFKADWPDTTVMYLHTNYRSSRNIVDTSNCFGKCIPDTKSELYVESAANRPPFQDVVYHCYTSPSEEADAVKTRITHLVKDGYSYGDIAILARTNEYLQEFKTALTESNIAYSTEYDTSIFKKPEVMLILCYMRLIVDHGDDDAFEYVYCRPKRSLGKSFLMKAKEIATEKHLLLYGSMEEAAQEHPKYPIGVKKLRSVIDECGGRQYKNIKEMIGDLRRLMSLDQFIFNNKDKDCRKEVVSNLDALEDIAAEYVDINQFLDDMRSISGSCKPSKDAVQLLTIHKAKGLEFPAVFVVGLNRGLFPSDKSEDINEERRLMYVAMTRAERELYVSSADGDVNDQSKCELVPAIIDKMSLNTSTQNEKSEDTATRNCGDFTWYIYDTAKLLMPDIKPATLTRLMLLATYMDYDNELVRDDGVRMTLDNMRDILQVSDRTMYNIMNELKSAGIMNFENAISVNPKIFFRGAQNRIEQSILYQDRKMIARLYRNGVRALYHSAKAGSAKKLSYIFRIMPFVNREYNIVCFNPLEKESRKIEPIPLGDLSEITGYGRSHASRFQSLLLDPVFETANGTARAVHYVSGDKIGIEHHCLFINPEVYYGGSRHSEVSILGRFK